MTEHEARAAPRLRFSKEEIQPENFQITSAKTKKAMKKAVIRFFISSDGSFPADHVPVADLADRVA